MYLFHLVVLEGITAVLGRRHGFGNLMVLGVYAAVLAAVSYLSYHYYESHFLNLKDRFFRRPGKGYAAGTGR
jgi:peptidoglycan/LPS O-acetylase OafA/YrhL